MEAFREREGKGRGDGTECSSCLTSNTVPSLKVHFTMSVSGEAPLTVSLDESLDQKVWKSGSLMRCQTEERGAGMTADSVMEVEVGIAVDILVRDDGCGGEWKMKIVFWWGSGVVFLKCNVSSKLHL